MHNFQPPFPLFSLLLFQPSKRQADIIVPVGINSVALSLITDHLKTALIEGGAHKDRYIKTPFDEVNKVERKVGTTRWRAQARSTLTTLSLRPL